MNPTKRVQRIDVVVDDGYDFAAVVAALRAGGMRVEHALALVGVVIGTVSPEYLDAIKALPGVKAITASPIIEISRSDGQSNANSA